MQIPKGFKINELITSDYILKLHRNIYGRNHSGGFCNKYLTNILVNKVGLSKSTVDECVFYIGNVIYVIYTYDSILADPYIKNI